MLQGVMTSFGEQVTSFTRQLGGIAILIRQIFRELWKRPVYPGLIAEQVYQNGLLSLGLVSLTALSTGMVMALQFGLGLEKFGGKLYVPKIVSLSIIREMGPVFCSLMIAARVGAGIASEIGSMVVTQQIDAIRALGTSPIKRIVIPRVLGCFISLPLLAAFANVIGILGAIIIGYSELGLDPQYCVKTVFATVTLTDYMEGLMKCAVFALFISITACFYGLRVTNGTRGVGSATTQAVVTGSVLVLIGDFFLTKLFHILFE